MNVKNRSCIRKLSFKALLASRKRNAIAVIAIILTSLMFTSLFTIGMSINASYQTYSFRQLGGYAHGSFKDVTEEQAEAIAGHSRVKESGLRTVIGFITDGVFAKVPAELSYMDERCAKWCYAEPTAGRAPQSANEIAMDTDALTLLGIEPELGAQITLTYLVFDQKNTMFEKTDVFTLVGYWEYDDLLPVHYLNISEEYVKAVAAEAAEKGAQDFRSDLYVMMASPVNIRGQMEQVDTDLGYDWETRDTENSVRIGVNWGYTSEQFAENINLSTLLAILAFLLLIIFTGYLIIYNIFQISVSGDIRFYGLLKTIGVTPQQLRRIIRQQALFLCIVGIPAGLLLGYGAGAVLTPVVVEKGTTFGTSGSTLSVSPLIFAAAILFTLITVLLSCTRPGRIASRVSPVEATKYAEALPGGSRKKHRGAKIHQMAFANLGRNKTKTVLVVISLSLSVVLLNVLVTFTGGFDMEKYLATYTCADFIVSSTDYFRTNQSNEYLSEDVIAEIEENTSQTAAGCGYTLSEGVTEGWMTEDAWRENVSSYYPEETVESALSQMAHRDGLVAEIIQIEGLDPELFDLLTVIDGSLDPLSDPDSHAIALIVSTDDYRNVYDMNSYPALGDTVPVSYVTEGWYIDSRTGEPCDDDTPQEYLQLYNAESRDVDYTVCAYVTVPFSMSYRYFTLGYQAILPADTLEADSGLDAVPLFYLFDTPDASAEAAAERYLAELTDDALSGLMYESKSSVRADFKSFQQLFLLLGGALCAIISLVGILNFFNAILTGIISRKREFAVLQAVGMTGRQLKAMLVYEGLFYALGAALIALILSLILSPLTGSLLENVFWFFSARFIMFPVLAAIPVFALLGWCIPTVTYRHASRQSVVERLRETE